MRGSKCIKKIICWACFLLSISKPGITRFFLCERVWHLPQLKCILCVEIYQLPEVNTINCPTCKHVTWVQIIKHQLRVEVLFISVWRKCLVLILMIFEINLKKKRKVCIFFFSPYFSALFCIRKLKKLVVLDKLCMFLFMLSYISLVQLRFSWSSGLSQKEYICTDTVVPWAKVL